MESRKVLRLFLASPGDVAAERAIVREIVSEWNLAVGQKRGLQVDVIGWETHVAPDYGSDSQSIINRQIGDMKRCALFVGILKHRFGTPTPREPSGTYEEFKRAERVHKRNGKLRIMMYFCDAPFAPHGKADMEQKQKVLDFRSAIQPLSIYQPYRARTYFHRLFSRHFHSWVEDWLATLPPSSKSVRAKPTTKAPVTQPKAPSVRKTAAPITVKPSTKLKVASIKPAKPIVKARVKSPASRTPTTISTAGKWLLLDGRLWRSESVSGEGNELVLKIVSRNGDEESVLRRLCERSHFSSLPFVYGRDAGQFRLTKCEHESAGKNTLWTLRGSLQRFNKSGWQTREETERRVRELLIGTTKDFDAQQAALLNSSGTAGIYNSLNPFPQPKPSLFASLLKETGLKPAEFLPFAFLNAVYRLKHDGLCEDVLELKLGPIKDKTLRVHFKGRTAQNYNNSTQIIEIDGRGVLSQG